MSTSLQSQVARRLARVRVLRGYTLRQVAADAGLNINTVRAYEKALHKHVYLDTLMLLCSHYNVSMVAIIEGWKGDPPAYEKPEDLDGGVRRRLRAARGTRGTPSVSGEAGVDQPWLVRIESGEYKRIDLSRLRRLAAVLGVSMTHHLLFPKLPECTDESASAQQTG